MTTAIDPTAVARVVGIKTSFVNLKGAANALPMRVGVVGQGSTASQASYATTKKQVFTSKEVGDEYGYGSPLHLAVDELLPQNGDGVGNIPVTIFPLKDDGSGVESVGTITPVGAQTAAQTYQILINKIPSQQFTLAIAATVADAVTAIVAAINGVISMPVIAADVASTSVSLTSKWKGASANDISVEVVGTVAGITFGLTQPTGGATNPDVDTALNQIGNVWETLIVNCLDIADTATLTKYTEFFEPRWGATIRKPAIVFSSTTETSLTTAIAIPEARKTDRINSQLVAPGSGNLPCVITARGVSRIAAVANKNAPVDYVGQPLTGIIPGTDAEQWKNAQRETAVKGGSSTVELVDNVLELSDTVTFYHPTGEEPPAYRYVNDIIKVMTVIYNLGLIFESDNWKGKVLIPDIQATANKDARKPKDAVAAISVMLDSLGLRAVISDPETAKTTITAGINNTNPRRLDADFTYQISGNTTILSIDANFGFFFGTPQIV